MHPRSMKRRPSELAPQAGHSPLPTTAARRPYHTPALPILVVHLPYRASFGLPRASMRDKSRSCANSCKRDQECYQPESGSRHVILSAAKDPAARQPPRVRLLGAGAVRHMHSAALVLDPSLPLRMTLHPLYDGNIFRHAHKM
jgi:hypothetical protein